MSTNPDTVTRTVPDEEMREIIKSASALRMEAHTRAADKHSRRKYRKAVSTKTPAVPVPSESDTELRS